MKFILPTLIVLVSAIAVTGLVHAKSHNPDTIVERVTKKLSLDDQQQQALRDFVMAKQSLRQQLKQERQEKKQQLDIGKFTSPFAALNQKESIEVSDITKIIDAKQAERREQRLPLLEKFVVFRNLLSQEQREAGQKVMKRMLRGMIHNVDKHHWKRPHS